MLLIIKPAGKIIPIENIVSIIAAESNIGSSNKRIYGFAILAETKIIVETDFTEKSNFFEFLRKKINEIEKQVGAADISYVVTVRNNTSEVVKFFDQPLLASGDRLKLDELSETTHPVFCFDEDAFITTSTNKSINNLKDFIAFNKIHKELSRSFAFIKRLSLNHPNIVSFWNFGVADNVNLKYVVMSVDDGLQIVGNFETHNNFKVSNTNFLTPKTKEEEEQIMSDIYDQEKYGHNLYAGMGNMRLLM